MSQVNARKFPESIYLYEVFYTSRNSEVHTSLSPSRYFFVQDVFRLLTPGGGGFGRPDDEDDDDNGPPRRRRKIDPIASQHYHEKGSVYAYRLAQESA